MHTERMDVNTLVRMKVVIVGSDTWKDIDAIWRELQPLWEQHGSKLVVGYPDRDSGACRLTDALCAQAGIDRVKVPLNIQRDDSDKHQLTLLFRMIRPDLILAFHPFINNSKRTLLAKRLAEEMGLVLRVVAR